jgi:D-sedoheptulose 7-phosphate isomerase
MNIEALIKDELTAVTASVSGVFQPAYLATVNRAADALVKCLASGGKVLIAGNGGSAADAQHIAAELVGRYVKERKALAGIALTVDTSILTAWSNDYSYDTVFSRQVEALGRPGDVFWGISTSGNSKNIVVATERAKALGLVTIGLLGRDGGKLAPLCDVAMTVPLKETSHIQVAHMMTYHTLCSVLDAVA